MGGSYLSGLLSACGVTLVFLLRMAGALPLLLQVKCDSGLPLYLTLGMGISAPLVLLGTAQGKWMPKSGAWMHFIRTLGDFTRLGFRY